MEDKSFPPGKLDMDVEAGIKRVDHLLENSPPQGSEKFGAALGIRLALGMALEIQRGTPLGSETAGLIAGWVSRYGEKMTEAAIQSARCFLKNPGALREKMEERLFDPEENPDLG